MNTALEYSTRVVQEGGRRCKKSTLNDLVHLTPLRIPLMNPPIISERSAEYKKGGRGGTVRRSKNTTFIDTLRPRHISKILDGLTLSCPELCTNSTCSLLAIRGTSVAKLHFCKDLKA
jgi:hypothetical protein